MIAEVPEEAALSDQRGVLLPAVRRLEERQHFGSVRQLLRRHQRGRAAAGRGRRPATGKDHAARRTAGEFDRGFPDSAVVAQVAHDNGQLVRPPEPGGRLGNRVLPRGHPVIRRIFAGVPDQLAVPEHPVEIVHRAASEVGGAVLASTTTSVCVFAPLLFLTGIIGIIMNDLSLAIVFALAASA
ncbi:MAG: efflux RND transporter permease subunit, partial [Opitutae bacterium]|nr:efflux RND transporter permease subunit [Opitutae bacterium]